MCIQKAGATRVSISKYHVLGENTKRLSICEFHNGVNHRGITASAKLFPLIKLFKACAECTDGLLRDEYQY